MLVAHFGSRIFGLLRTLPGCQDLTNKIRELFAIIDTDGNGSLNYNEIQVAAACRARTRDGQRKGVDSGEGT